MAKIINFLVVIRDEVLGSLVDSVVGEVDVEVVQVALVGAGVFFSCKSRKPFLVDEEAEWIDSIDQCVDSQIEFEVVDNIGLVEVALCNQLAAGVHILKVPR